MYPVREVYYLYCWWKYPVVLAMPKVDMVWGAARTTWTLLTVWELVTRRYDANVYEQRRSIERLSGRGNVEEPRVITWHHVLCGFDQLYSSPTWQLPLKLPWQNDHSDFTGPHVHPYFIWQTCPTCLKYLSSKIGKDHCLMFFCRKSFCIVFASGAFQRGVFCHIEVTLSLNVVSFMAWSPMKTF